MGKEKKTYSSAEEEMEARQKKLIPLNIVVAVMAHVAAISILFLPLLRLNVEDAAELMAARSLRTCTAERCSSSAMAVGDTVFSPASCFSARQRW